MKHLTALAFVLILLPAKAQTVTSIADGAWDDPATWDCGCVPAVSAVVHVQHHVTKTMTSLYLSNGLYVNAGGQLDIVSVGNFSYNGIGLFIDPGGAVDIVGFAYSHFKHTHVNGTLVGNMPLAFHYGDNSVDGIVFAPTVKLNMQGGTFLMNNGSIHATDLFEASFGDIQGAGQICASDTLRLYDANISGTIDLCDLSPTVTVPPIVDLCNSCTVAPTVTYCNGSSCMASVHEASSAATLSIYPNPAHDHVTFEGMPVGAEIKLYDGLGQLVRAPGVALGTRTTVDLSGLAKGIYLATATKGKQRLTTRLVVE